MKAVETYVVGELQEKDGKVLVRMDMPVDTTVASISLGEMPGPRYVCGDAGIEKVVLMTGEDIKKPKPRKGQADVPPPPPGHTDPVKTRRR